MANFLKKKVKRLTNLKLKEISGVDDPASLHEGWAVLKSSDNELEQALGKAIQPFPTDQENITVETETTNESQAEEVVEEVVIKSDDTQVQKELADVRKELDQARAEMELLREQTETEKALNDAQAWANVPGLDPVEFAPVLRSLRSTNADSAAMVENILDACSIALGEAGVLKEIGSEGTPETEDAYGQIETMAKALVESGEAISLADGISKVATQNQELYSAYVADQRGA